MRLLPRSVARSVKGAGDRVVVADSKELKLPIKKLEGDKRIKTKGQRRGTRYFAR